MNPRIFKSHLTFYYWFWTKQEAECYKQKRKTGRRQKKGYLTIAVQIWCLGKVNFSKKLKEEYNSGTRWFRRLTTIGSTREVASLCRPVFSPSSNILEWVGERQHLHQQATGALPFLNQATTIPTIPTSMVIVLPHGDRSPPSIHTTLTNLQQKQFNKSKPQSTSLIILNEEQSQTPLLLLYQCLSNISQQVLTITNGHSKHQTRAWKRLFF